MKSNFLEIYRTDAKPMRFLFVLILAGVAYGLYKGVQDNYLVEILRITPFERGIVEFLRELPGLFLIFILASMHRFAESRVFKIGSAIMFAGMVGLMLCKSDKFIVVIFMVIWSTGEHIVLPLKSTISLDLSKKESGGAALGIMNTLYNAGNISGFLIVTIIFFIFEKLGFARISVIPFRVVFCASASLMLAAFLVSLAITETKLKAPRRRLYFSKKFFTFYVLEIFYGARKQVFMTFAPLVLIREYGAPTSLIAILLAVCAGCAMIFSPLIGRLIDKLGYRTIMIADTLILIAVCFFYGFSHRIFPAKIAFVVVCVNYILDSIISLCSMATNVYVKDISVSQEELTATLSTGISVNHLISVFIALFGGYIWNITGIEVLFSISAFLGLMNSLYAATIKSPRSVNKPQG